MKKVIFISAIIILLGLVSYIFVIKKSVNHEPPQPVLQNKTEVPSQPSSAPAIDVNDNLNQAIQDLDQAE